MNTNDPNPQSPPAAFDPEKAARLRRQAIEAFNTHFKNVERRLYCWLAFLLVFGVCGAWSFSASTEVRDWILYGILLLIVVEGTVLMKLWFWIVNNKLSVLREIKMLRLDLGLQRGALSALEGANEPLSRPHGLGRWERWAWKTVIVLLAVGIGVGMTPPWARSHGQSRMTSQRTVTLRATGLARVETVYSLHNNAATSIRECSIGADGAVSAPRFVPADESAYTDGYGRKLPVRVEPAGPSHVEVVALPEPVRPGERFLLRSVFDTKAVEEGGVWTYRMRQNWGYRESRYIDTVELPAGATVVGTEPAAVSQETRDGRTVLRFEATRKRGAAWENVVRYRLSSQHEDPARRAGP